MGTESDVPAAPVDEGDLTTSRRDQSARTLPAQLTVYDVLAATLFSSAGDEEVLRNVAEVLRWTSDGKNDGEMPSQVTISKAQLGLKP